MRLDYCLENTEADSSKHTGAIKTNEADCGKSSKAIRDAAKITTVECWYNPTIDIMLMWRKRILTEILRRLKKTHIKVLQVILLTKLKIFDLFIIED